MVFYRFAGLYTKVKFLHLHLAENIYQISPIKGLDLIIFEVNVVYRKMGILTCIYFSCPCMRSIMDMDSALFGYSISRQQVCKTTRATLLEIYTKAPEAQNDAAERMLSFLSSYKD